jgi:hypothetical protein
MRSERVGLGGGGHPLDLGPSVRGGVERETTLPPSSSLRTILPPLRDMVYR